MTSPMPDPTLQYEDEMARLTGVQHVIAFGFARHAIAASLKGAGLGKGDEVILSPLTCKAVPLALLSMGLRPVYADISVTTLNLDTRQISSCISTKTRAILFQHTYGFSDGIQAVSEIADQHGLFLVEDCAHCMPVYHEHYAPGHQGAAAVFSNNPGKPLSVGSGGIATTNDPNLAESIRSSRNSLPARSHFGEARLYLEELLYRYILRPSLYWTLFGLKMRLDRNYTARRLEDEISGEIDHKALRPSARQMRLGLRNIGTITEIEQHRIECCNSYARSLGRITGLEIPYVSHKIPLYYYPMLVNNKVELLKKARRKRVELIPWPLRTPVYPIENFAALESYGYTQGCCPLAESIAGRLVGLPTHTKVTPSVHSEITGFLERNARL